MRCCLFIFFLLIQIVPLHAQAQGNAAPVDYETARFSRIAHAQLISDRIAIDGQLDEPAWQTAEPLTSFLQSGRSRNPGSPATERTEVRFLYDRDNLYVGVTCFDSEMSAIIVNGLTKDFPTNLGDEFGFILDSLNDDRSGFFFGTNPGGARADLQLANESQYNEDWDAVWDVQVRREADRWVAEFVVPFKTLRFSNSEKQEWGLNMVRKIRRRNEEDYWSPVPRRFGLSRISLAGTLTGLEGIRQGRNLKVKPYAKAGISQVRTAGGLQSDGDFNGGVDLKYGVTPSLTLDATYRTDFSQAEVDQDQVNLTRFNLVFPEKREFFLENAGVFAFGSRQASTSGRAGGENVVPFFSRSIGLSKTGSPIPIVGGTRVSGTVGKYELGVLAMKTERNGATPSSNFIVGRLKKNLFGNSFIGAIATNRDSTATRDYNRTFGTDAVFQFYGNLDVYGYILKSQTPGRAANDRAGKFATAWRDDAWGIGAAYERVERNFNPEAGFIGRPDNSRYSGDISFQPRIDSSTLIRNLTFTASHNYYAGRAGKVETRQVDGSAGIVFENGATLTFKTTDNSERLAAVFARYSIPKGDYTFRSSTLSYSSDRSRKIGGRVDYTRGGFWNGVRRAATADLTLKPNFHWQVSTNYSRNDITLPSGHFISTLVGVKVLYAYSSRAFLNTFVQYNAELRQVSTNMRFNIIHHPLSDIFVVLNERRDTATGRVLDRGLVFKFTNLFNF